MLVISQQEGEILEIGEDVRILIRECRGGWVRLAVDAPRDVAVRRVQADEPSDREEESVGAVVSRRRRPR